jgi:hypothetical protein
MVGDFLLGVNHLLFGKFLISFYKNHPKPVKGKDSQGAGATKESRGATIDHPSPGVLPPALAFVIKELEKEKGWLSNSSYPASWTKVHLVWLML